MTKNEKLVYFNMWLEVNGNKWIENCRKIIQMKMYQLRL